MKPCMILEKSVDTRKSAQVLDSPSTSTSYIKKVFITNKVTSHFFITLFESINGTSFPRSTNLSRMMFIVFFYSLLAATNSFAECINKNANIDFTKPNTNYRDNNDGTITDIKTGLMWQKCSLGLTGPVSDFTCSSGTIKSFTWLTALEAANNDINYGYSDWRLPNVNELTSLIETACFSPSINETLFPATSLNDYWTSTPFIASSTDVNYVNFQQGDISSIQNNRLKSLSKNVRLVRGMQ